jgi:acetyl-CoA carboxylase biotin carboxylase subunit
MTIKSLFIANRGEIAVRIIRAAKELGIKTIQGYSAADKDSLAVQLANTSVEIGPAHASKSYLDIERVINAAKECGAEAIHPGYGFLSENAEFVDAVEANGMIFIGPNGETISLLGDKVSARKAAINAGTPVVPGSEGRLESKQAAKQCANDVGFPLMIKASAGGGGRGMRVVDKIEDLERCLDECQAEAQAAFGDDGVFIEKLITKARHVEVQIMGDGNDVVHFFERECSLQRRRQKVWEEAPAICLTNETREKLCETAVSLARSLNYRGAGTVEYLYDPDTEGFYFIEMNTRIQVEHPVTEAITGVDLVREMIRVCSGEALAYSQNDINMSGHALECRINAEDPSNQFMPSPGTVSDLSLPGGPWVRFDTLLYKDCVIPPFYDSMLGKLIVWDTNREQALTRMHRALDELKVEGIAVNTELHKQLIQDANIKSGDFNTHYLEEWLENK